MFTLQVKDDGTQAALSELAAKLTDMTPLMAQIVEFLLDGTLDRFKTGHAPDGSAWAAKSQTTIDAYIRRKQPVSFRPLIGPTKTLSAASSFATSSGADWARLSARPIQSAVMQFGAKKGAFGNNKAGRPIPWGDIPARPFMGVSDQDHDNILAAVAEWISSST